MGLVAAVIASSVVGAGTSIYGANKQSSATASAQDANVAQQDKQNLSSWQNYLMTRGFNPSTVTQTGQVPVTTSTGTLNTKMPLWANYGSNFGQPKRFVKAGTSTPSTSPTGYTSAPAVTPTNWWTVPSKTGQTALA